MMIDIILPLSLRVLVFTQTAIGIAMGTRSFGFRDLDKNSAPSVQFLLCNYPLFPCFLLQIINYPCYYDFWHFGRTEWLLCLDLLIGLASIVTWELYFYKHRKLAFMPLLFIGFLFGYYLIYIYLSVSVKYYLGVAANCFLIYSLFGSVRSSINEAKSNGRSVSRVTSALLIQTAYEGLLLGASLYSRAMKEKVIGTILGGIGVILCVVLWMADCFVVAKENAQNDIKKILADLIKECPNAFPVDENNEKIKRE
eukprot:TRINITY_DN7840_c0_g2_i1.p1 TRINITY_DN7840_c0_g2~~TRINITY_DN7840_c0_g2_i1.p1  ORF type:complete len:254 (-),score=25.84 TRINITY_DN7840_c0_g2_i1:69-830(-)